MAGSSVRTCEPKKDAMMQTCLPKAFTLRCREGTVDGSAEPDYATENSISCKACGFSRLVRDQDPNPGKYWITLTFGAVAALDGTILPPSNILAYKLAWVDSDGRWLADLTSLEAGTYSTACCNAMQYRVVLRGTYPKRFSRIAIKPVSFAGSLPYTDFTEVITDSVSGKVQKVEGSFSIETNSLYARVFTKSADAKWALQTALADSLGGLVNAVDIYIEAMFLNGNKIKTRRLAPATIKVDYVILTADTGKPIDPKGIDPMSLKRNIEKQSRALVGIPLKVTAMPILTARSNDPGQAPNPGSTGSSGSSGSAGNSGNPGNSGAPGNPGAPGNSGNPGPSDGGPIPIPKKALTGGSAVLCIRLAILAAGSSAFLGLT